MSNLVFSSKREAVEFLRNMKGLKELSGGNFFRKGFIIYIMGNLKRLNLSPSDIKTAGELKRFIFTILEHSTRLKMDGVLHFVMNLMNCN